MFYMIWDRQTVFFFSDLGQNPENSITKFVTMMQIFQWNELLVGLYLREATYTRDLAELIHE